MFIYLHPIEIPLKLRLSNIPQGTLSTIGNAQPSVMCCLIHGLSKDIGVDGRLLRKFRKCKILGQNLRKKMS